MSNEKILVQNLTDNDVIYIDDNGGISRRIVFHSQQTMPFEKDMIERMRYDRGGSVLLKDFLSVKDEEIRTEIGIPADQIEYDWTAADVKELLINGSDDALRDALEFGPKAIQELIVSQAVSLPLGNRDKVNIISEMTDKNIESMIKNKLDFEKGKEAPAPKTGRRVQSTKAEPGRRVVGAKEQAAEKKQTTEEE